MRACCARVRECRPLSVIKVRNTIEPMHETGCVRVPVCVYDHLFRSSMKRGQGRVIGTARKNEEPVIDSIRIAAHPVYSVQGTRYSSSSRKFQNTTLHGFFPLKGIRLAPPRSVLCQFLVQTQISVDD